MARLPQGETPDLQAPPGSFSPLQICPFSLNPKCLGVKEGPVGDLEGVFSWKPSGQMIRFWGRRWRKPQQLTPAPEQQRAAPLGPRSSQVARVGGQRWNAGRQSTCAPSGRGPGSPHPRAGPKPSQAKPHSQSCRSGCEVLGCGQLRKAEAAAPLGSLLTCPSPALRGAPALHQQKFPS